MFSVSRKFRVINITDESKGGKERNKIAGQMRAIVLQSLDQLRKYYWHLPGLNNNPAAPTLLEVADLRICRDNPNFHQELRDACNIFTAFDQGGSPYYFTLADTAGEQDSPDGLISETDLGYFRDEIAEYRDETEFDQPDIEAMQKGCSDWGKAEAGQKGDQCKSNAVMSERCSAHQNHRISDDPRLALVRGQCWTACIRSWREACPVQ